MARFPKSEAEIAALASNMVTGFGDNITIYPDPIVSTVNLGLSLALYNTKKADAVATAATAAAAIVDKDAALAELVENMRKDLSYAENVTDDNAEQLQLIGWDGRKAPTPLAVPGQTLALEAPVEGEGTILLMWKTPANGGAVAAYNIQRRQRPEGAWQQISMAMTTDIELVDQPRATEWEYRIIGVNKAGEGLPSNTVMAVL